jgi:hypothetical protein
MSGVGRRRAVSAGTDLKVLAPREAEIFESLIDTYCWPEGDFPAVADTDAVAFIDDLAARSVKRNVVGFRALLAFVDFFPLMRGYRHRFRQLDRRRRAKFLHELDRSRLPALALPGKLLKALSMMAYYGDDAALRAAGYDPERNLARARAVRSAENRT